MLFPPANHCSSRNDLVPILHLRFEVDTLGCSFLPFAVLTRANAAVEPFPESAPVDVTRRIRKSFVWTRGRDRNGRMRDARSGA